MSTALNQPTLEVQEVKKDVENRGPEGPSKDVVEQFPEKAVAGSAASRGLVSVPKELRGEIIQDCNANGVDHEGCANGESSSPLVQWREGKEPQPGSSPNALQRGSCGYSKPKLQAFPSRTSMTDLAQRVSPAKSPLGSLTSISPFEIQTTVPLSTRYAFADLVTTVLRLDFYRPLFPESVSFCKLAFDILVTCVGLPEKTEKSLREHMVGEAFNEDVAMLIISIKEDAVMKERGTSVFVAMLLLQFVESGNYDSRYRVLLRHLCTLLGVVWHDFEEIEDSLAIKLLNQEFIESEHSKQVREKTQRGKKIKRFLMIGAASGVGGVLIGLTGGLAAPLVAAGAGVVIGAGAAAGIATTAGAAVLGSAFGIAGAGLAGYKMKKRVGAIEEFEVQTLSEGTSLRTILAVSGWIDKDTKPEEAFLHQWRHLSCAKEQYTLHYESRYLTELGNALDYLMSFAVSMAIQQTLMETALHGLMAAVAWPVALISASSVLDNPWNVCVSRATEVGEHLAEVLLSRAHGNRPITLVGFSLGARVIFHCLLTMSRRTENLGIIEDVILLGAPVSASSKQWAQACTVVAGRVINGYCETDWLLRFLYRTMSAQFTIAGTGPVDNKNIPSIVNHNLSHIVKGHLDYSRKLTEVLSAVQLKVTPLSEESLLNLAEAENECRESGKTVQSKREVDADVTAKTEFTVGEEAVEDMVANTGEGMVEDTVANTGEAVVEETGGNRREEMMENVEIAESHKTLN